MSEVPETSKVEEVKAELKAFAEELKAEVSDRLDQKLDELGAKL